MFHCASQAILAYRPFHSKVDRVELASSHVAIHDIYSQQRRQKNINADRCQIEREVSH